MKKIFLLVAALVAVSTPVEAKKEKVPENSDDRVVCYDLKTERRRIVSVPDIDGYITLKGDFHLHTVFADATVSPQGRVREAWCDGLDVMAMTPHVGVHKNNTKTDISVIVNQNYLGAIMLYQLSALLTHRIGQNDLDLISANSPHQCKADSLISAGRLDNHRIFMKQTLLLRI